LPACCFAVWKAHCDPSRVHQEEPENAERRTDARPQEEEGIRTMRDVRIKKKRKTARSPRKLTALDDFLKAEGQLEEFEAIAIKEVLA
jgi:hypothetical protein